MFVVYASFGLDIRRERGLTIFSHRRKLKQFIVDEVGHTCACCGLRPGYDLHEVFVPRTHVPKREQGGIFVRENCALVCVQCHRPGGTETGAVHTEEFKARFRARLRRLGYVPFDDDEEVSL